MRIKIGIVVFTFFIFLACTKQEGDKPNIVNNKIILEIEDSNSFFAEIKGQVYISDLMPDMFSNNQKNGKGEYYNFSFTKKVKLWGVDWPEKTIFDTGLGYVVTPSQDVLVKGYWIKSGSRLSIHEKNLSRFKGILGKQIEMTIEGTKRICPVNSQFLIEDNKPYLCCIARECHRDDWGVKGFKD